MYGTRWIRLVAAAGLVVALTSGCSGSGKPHSTATSTAPSKAKVKISTFEEAAATRRSPDGSVPKDLAFDAYSEFVGPLPGWTIHHRMTSTGVTSGTFAVLWALKYWALMSAAQRSAVVGTSPAATPSSAHSFLARVHSAVDPLQTRLQAEAATDEMRIARLIGRTLDVPFEVTVWDTHVGEPSEFATTIPLRAADGRRLGGCRGRFNPDLPTSEAEFTSLVAHEVFHCFQFALYPDDFHATSTIPDWIMEGEAAWVGEQISGGSSLPALGNWWRVWLTNPGEALSERQYSAIGLLSDVDEITHSLETQLDILVADPGGAYARLLRSDPGRIRSDWATRLVRQPSYGDDWESVGPGLTGDRATPLSATLDPGATIHLGPFPASARSAAIANVYLQGDAVRIQPTGSSAAGAIRTSDDTVTPLHGTGTVTLCLKSGGCACPDGSQPLGDAAPAAPGASTIALSADSPGTVQFSSVVLESECHSPSPSSPPASHLAAALDPALVGTWQSVRWHFPPVVADRTGGGDGMRMQLHPDGTATMDFSAMRPVSLVKMTSGVQSLGGFSYSGVGAATWGTGGGALRITYDDPHGFHYHFEFSAGGTRIPPINGDFAHAAAGSPAGPLTNVDYVAAGSTLTLIMTIPRGLGSITITLDKV